MNFLNFQIRDKILLIIVVTYLLFLAHSEALKNIAIYLMIIYFIFQIIIGKVVLTKDILNISIIAHLFIVIIGIWIGINSKESLDQFMDVVHIVLVFLFFREFNLKFLTYEKILQCLLVGFVFAIAYGMYFLFMHGGVHTSYTRLELHSVGSVNRSSVYMMFIFVTALCFIDFYKKNLSRYLFPATLIISTISILIAASRMAVFSLPLVIILYYVILKKISFKNILLIILSSTILILTLLNLFEYSSAINMNSANFIDFFIFKFSNGLNDPIRIQLWSSVLEAWKENNLWFGIGVGNSIFIDVAKYFPDTALSRYIDNAHNVYLDMLLERGIFGLITFISFMTSIFFIKSNHTLISSIFLKLLVFSLLLMGFANITFRYEFALLFVTLVGAFLNPSIKKYT